ncbi:MAG TPA: hypothetical protein VFE46_07840 [Pirellulales bacterium]|jgi:hypothetical protein|nr:hypothetical protein [Pirellulales bacterium]
MELVTPENDPEGRHAVKTTIIAASLCYDAITEAISNILTRRWSSLTENECEMMIGLTRNSQLSNVLVTAFVLQSTLATWWGYRHKFLREMLCGRKAVPFHAANRLRGLFGCPEVVVKWQHLEITLGKVPLSPAVKTAFTTGEFQIDQLRVVIGYLKQLNVGPRSIERALGLPRQYLWYALKNRRRDLCQELLRRLFDWSAEGGAR